MSLESAIADLVSASTQLTKSVNVTRATVEATRDTVIAQEAPVTTAKDATAASATAATTDAATTAIKLAAVAADYATQKTTKGLAAVQTSADSELKDSLHRRDPARHPFRGARPSLVMDFVRQECHRNNAAGNLEQVDLSSFMTFTRGSTATYVGPDGLIKTAGVNEARYGYDPVTGEALGLLIEEQRTNLIPGGDNWASWEVNNVFIPPVRLTTPRSDLSAYKMCERAMTASEFYIRKSCGVLPAASYCLSVYIHESSERTLRLRPTHTSCPKATSELTFNMQTKTFDFPLGYTSLTACGFAAAGGGWYRVWMTFTTPASSVVQAGFNTMIGVNTAYTGDGVSGLYLWGAQLEAGSFPTSYIPTPATFTGRASTKTYFDSNGVMQTAANDVAVTDYGYVDGRWVSKGLSLEPQATNLLIQSQDFSGWTWNYSTGTTVTRGEVISPTGLASCLDLTTDASGTIGSGLYKSGTSATAGTTYTASVFVKKGVGSLFCLSFEGATAFGGSTLIGLNPTTGGTQTIGQGGAAATVTVKDAGDWYRLCISRTAVADGTANICVYSGMTGANRFVIYGAQLETGPVATSYIPTTTAQVTRAADTSTSAQVTRAADSADAFSIGSVIGLDSASVVVTADVQRNKALFSWTNRLFILFAANIQNQRMELSTTGVNTFSTNSSGVNVASYAQAWPTIGSRVTGAVNFNRTSTKSFITGSAVYSASHEVLRLPAVRLSIGQNLNGYIRQLTYFPRQLSDADLQALTILED